MTLGLGSLTSELDRKETAFQSLPQSELMRKRQVVRGAGLPPSLTEALVAEKVLNDKAAAANAMAASIQSDPRTVAQQNEVEIRRQAEMEVAKAVGQANANKMQRQQKNMQKLASMDPRMLQRKGLAAAPVQQKQFSAQGGIVRYQDGGFVDTLKDVSVAFPSCTFHNVPSIPVSAIFNKYVYVDATVALNNVATIFLLELVGIYPYIDPLKNLFFLLTSYISMILIYLLRQIHLMYQ